MLTRQGFVLLVAGAIAVAIGRIFGVIELFVIGAGCFAAVVAAVVYVNLRRPRIEATRWIHPAVLVAGDTGRVDLHLHHRGSMRSAAFVLCESVRRTMGADHAARLPIDPMARGQHSTTGYSLPSASRGVIVLGPLEAELRDPLGIACTASLAAGTAEVVVAPRAFMLDMPQLGRGALGNALLDKARRLGPGEFHGLREYVDGDEPRSIHWKASARSDALMVKEYTVEGLHRFTVVFDASPDAHGDAAAFERGVTAAASLVSSAVRSGLSTRFVTSGGIDLRGPEVGIHTSRVLARIEPSSAPMATLDRETGDGLGLTVVITGSRVGPAWRTARSIVDPTVTLLLVATDEVPPSGLDISARSDDDFVRSWQTLAGRGRVDLMESAS